MRLISAPLGGGWLRDCLAASQDDCVRVRAAIAYADYSNMELFKACLGKGKPLDFYGRYDFGLPVDPRVLRWFHDLKSLNIRCHLVPDFLHAKVIWWVDAGAYIGSANLTDRAWNKNYEAGCFFTREEIVDLGLEEQLTAFFENLDDHAQPLTKEIVEEQEAWAKRLGELERRRREIEEEFGKSRLLRAGIHPTSINRESAQTRHYRSFEEEWNSTLQVMRNIAAKVASDEFRPDWVPSGASSGAQADQFLHAFYYQQVREGNQYPVDRFFAANENRRDAALTDALRWWKAGSYDSAHENKMLSDWAERIRRIFSRESLATLTEAQWIEAASRVHSIRDYAGKHSSAELGSPEGQLENEEKIQRHCRILWSRRSQSGRTVRELLQYVIWGRDPIAERLWKGHRTPEWKIEGIGLSSLGEIVGWSRPDEYPPRNMRTSKGLRALGHPVRVG